MMTAEPKIPIENSKRFNLGYLFFVTTMVAIGFGLCVRPLHPAVQGIGLSIVLFWLSRGIFVVSKLLPIVAREAVFLFGLPLFIGSMLFLVLSLLFAAIEMVEYLSR